ncbi:MAG: metalloregulator ArsR/SmtB family transcription factor [Phycisphaerales bacterium]|nr:metalloregulator ArsR/SmtB family transcription factor [Phycisphaerales bacterium]
MSSAAAPPLLQWIEPLNDLARLRILRVLDTCELGVGELASVLQLPQSTVSRHLKRLLEAGWIARRSVGTAALYRLATTSLDDTARTLWDLAAASLVNMPVCAEDDHRAEEVIARRHVDSRRFFGDLGGEWTDLRERLFGEAVAIHPLLALCDPGWIVGDLGCGTGQTAAQLAHWVKRVEAIDRESAMLKAARKRLTGVDNVGIHKADILDLPFEDDSLDAAIVSLVLHHLESPADALREISRITSGPILVVDMMSHDRTSYRDTMGHLHLGFEEDEVQALARQAGVTMQRYSPLPPDPSASGPSLFVARLLAQ